MHVSAHALLEHCSYGVGDTMIKLAAALSACLLLSACGASLSGDYRPVLLHENDVEDLRRRLTSLPPKDMLLEGVTISNARCDQFFESIDNRRDNADFALGRLAALSTGLPQALEAASVSSQAVANVAAALGFATGWIKDSKELYLFVEFKPAIYSKWQRARDQAKDQILKLVTSGRDIPYSYAKDQLYEYTRLCMRHQLKAWLFEAANSGRLVGVNLNEEDKFEAQKWSLRKGYREEMPGLPQIRPMVVQ